MRKPKQYWSRAEHARYAVIDRAVAARRQDAANLRAITPEGKRAVVPYRGGFPMEQLSGGWRAVILPWPDYGPTGNGPVWRVMLEKDLRPGKVVHFYRLFSARLARFVRSKADWDAFEGLGGGVTEREIGRIVGLRMPEKMVCGTPFVQPVQL